MPSVEDRVEVCTPLAEAFAYFAEFANIAEWDPGVESVRKHGSGPLALGDTYAVISRFGGRLVPIAYEVTLLESPHRICLRGLAPSGQADDDIRFEAVEGGTKITWRLDFAPKGLVANLARPFLGILLSRLARDTMAGIKAASKK
tara:strand:- start:31362 stop:31796 length:435 start_codon:yes stop_codon:yes gene_type:complete